MLPTKRAGNRMQARMRGTRDGLSKQMCSMSSSKVRKEFAK